MNNGQARFSATIFREDDIRQSKLFRTNKIKVSELVGEVHGRERFNGGGGHRVKSERAGDWERIEPNWGVQGP